MPFRVCAVLALCCIASPAVAAIVVDGRRDEPEWRAAQRFDDFRVTAPYTLDAPALRTTAWLLSTPEGIAVAFECEHPATVPRLRPRVERDQRRTADRVNFMIDFDGDGRQAYDFAVLLSGSIQDDSITGENAFNPDWNPDWLQAVEEDADAWRVEMLIPWSVAAMRDGSAGSRRVAVYFDRVIGATDERQAFPAATFERGRFVSDFHPIEIPQFRQSTLDVFPYVTAQQDFVRNRNDVRSGVDVFWKPSAGFQLSAALNPDFGQVEADELVINFDAIETYYSDKRPFFTENQGMFDVTTPDSGQLVYTRRIGGPRDDGSGLAADIDAAVKLNGAVGRLGYGVLAAQESDVGSENGRTFAAQRLLLPVDDSLSVGYLGTWADRPLLDRDADVQTVDLSWRPSPAWVVNAQALASTIDQAGSERHGDGAWVRAFWLPTPLQTYEVEATHFARELDFSDLGFQRRAGLNELEITGELRRNVDDPDARVRSRRWRAELQARSNDSGDRLPTVLVLTHTAEFGSGAFAQLEGAFETDGIDDLISRGNGHWRRPARNVLYGDWRSPVRGGWQTESEFVYFEEGLSDPALQLIFTANWFVSDALNLEFGGGPLWSRDWLIWDEANRFDRFRRRALEAEINLNWFPAQRHELRVKTQWLAIRAHDGRRYVLDGSGAMRPTGAPSEDFSLNNFGLQLRYRYEVAVQSELFLVYSRGGVSRHEDDIPGARDLFDEALTLRDADQFLAKLRYRF
ncbi:DUF5916 domain-containing protein [Chiayiivirga flava]|uniref:DUF5916 domain-containing protein n=1 Tax=Chiayiivirga flava TaxID=659595 RepID=A0A7W8D2H5_9GAMM|nr:DUF5916 domain-containing protein [Chiayiivirga flava]MBB5206624.1 hypothetical protein [Chiayiivirga flava]